MVKKLNFFIMLTMVLAGIFTSGCDKINDFINPPPPLRLSLRNTDIPFSSGKVLIVSNYSDKIIQCNLNCTRKDPLGILGGNYNGDFSLNPGESKEFGLNQIGTNFYTYDFGQITVHGFDRKMNFSVQENGLEWYPDK